MSEIWCKLHQPALVKASENLVGFSTPEALQANLSSFLFVCNDALSQTTPASALPLWFYQLRPSIIFAISALHSLTESNECKIVTRSAIIAFQKPWLSMDDCKSAFLNPQVRELINNELRSLLR